MRAPRFFIVCSLSLAFGPGARAQLAEGGARALALGRAATALGGEVWGQFNPATWSTLEHRTAALFASRAFGLSETTLAALAAAAPTRWGTPAVTARTYGFEDYRETHLGVGFARALPLSPTRRLHVGLHVRYDGVSIPGFGSKGAVGLSAGALVQVTGAVQAGLHARNLTRLAVSDSASLEASLATAPALAVGLAYRPTPRALLVLDAEKDLDFPLAVRGGVEVFPVEVLALRVGAASAPVRFSAGVGVRTGPLRADVAVERHETLGLTPAVALGVEF